MNMHVQTSGGELRIAERRTGLAGGQTVSVDFPVFVGMSHASFKQKDRQMHNRRRQQAVLSLDSLSAPTVACSVYVTRLGLPFSRFFEEDGLPRNQRSRCRMM